MESVDESDAGLCDSLLARLDGAEGRSELSGWGTQVAIVFP
jgi:hypothetical protein